MYYLSAFDVFLTLKLISRLFGVHIGSYRIKSTDGTQIWAEAKGVPTNPHVVWIHGFPSGAIAFDRLFDDPTYLSKLYMVRYDLRGSGQSDKPLDASLYQSARFAEDFDAVVQTFKLNEPVVAAWSYGGTIPADIYALHGTGAISGIIYLSGIPYMNAFPVVATAENSAILPLYLQDNITISDGALQTFIGLVFQNPNVITFTTRAAWVGLSGFIPQSVKSILPSRQQDQTRFVNEAGPSLPILYIEGSKDRVINGTTAVGLLQPTFKKLSVFTLPNSGHTVFLEEFETVRDQVLKFVANTTQA